MFWDPSPSLAEHLLKKIDRRRWKDSRLLFWKFRLPLLKISSSCSTVDRPGEKIALTRGGEQHANNKSLINQSEQNAILRNVSYQLSTPMPFSPEIKNGGGSPSGQAIGAASGGVDTKCISLCRKVGIDPLDLVFWMQNLRIWQKSNSWWDPSGEYTF